MPKALLLLAAAACLVVPGAGLGVLFALLPEAPVARGLFLGGRLAPPGEQAAAWLESRRDELASRRVHLAAGGRTFVSTLGDLGIELDVAATLERARARVHRGGVVDRLRASLRARRHEFDVPLAFRFDRDVAERELSALAPLLRRAPVDARIDLREARKTPDEPGEELDVLASLERIAEGTREEEEHIELAMREIPPRVTLADLPRVDLERTVAEYETRFKTWGDEVGRAANIRLAASRIHGTILAPGDVFSFNDAVGPRTVENGFRRAPEIFIDEMVDGIGGGTCQVSSTLHAAAVHAGLDVPLRVAHSRVSSYVPMGLDATVVYPDVDLKIQNSLSHPIVLRAYLPRAGVLRVEIRGGEPAADVEYRYGISDSEGYLRRIWVDPTLEPGKARRRQRGVRGFEVTSLARLRHTDGRVEERRWRSLYRPSPEVYWVSPDYDLAALPPLPEGATGIEPPEVTAKVVEEIARRRM